MNATRSTTLALLLALPLVAGCSKTDDGYRIEGEKAKQGAQEAGDQAGRALEAAGEKLQKGAAELERRAQPVLEDAALSAKVKAKLAADPEVRAYLIDVDTLEHVVTLSGRVESEAVRAEAEKLARNTKGVRAVVNNLVIGDEPIPGSEPGPAAGPASPG